jgi:hypothetical protein
MYVSKQLQYKTRNDISINVENRIETSFIEICTNKGKNIIIGTIYRPPNNKIDTFENSMKRILEKIDKEKKIGYLMGDFNIDLLKSESCDYAGQFTEQLFTSSYYPLITKPTRITAHTATLIDNIFTNNIENIDSSLNGIIFSDISDHLPIVHICNMDSNSFNIRKKVTKTSKYKRVINNANIKSFTNTIKNISWDNVIDNNNPEKAFDKFSQSFTEAYETSFPVKLTKEKIDNNKSPWMTYSILKSVNRKHKLYKAYLLNSNKRNENTYKRYKNKLNHIIKVSKKLYYEEQLIKYKNDTKMIWYTLNKALNKNRKKKEMPKSFFGNNSMDIIDDPKKIANGFNEYFINVGPNLAKKIKENPDMTFDNYLTSNYPNSMFLDPITENELVIEINSMNPNKSPGHDDISIQIVKSHAKEVSKPLTHIFNLTFLNGIFLTN